MKHSGLMPAYTPIGDIPVIRSDLGLWCSAGTYLFGKAWSEGAMWQGFRAGMGAMSLVGALGVSLKFGSELALLF